MSSVKQSVTLDLQLRQLLLPKLGQEVSECEDVIAVDAERAGSRLRTERLKHSLRASGLNDWRNNGYDASQR